MEADTLAAARELDFSLVALFLRATLVVQLVMVLLIVASVWSWAIIIAKSMAFARARRQADAFEEAFWSGRPLDELAERLGDAPPGAMARVFVAGMAEWRKSHRETGLIPGALQRIERAMRVAVNREAEALEARLGFLATVGATAPFVGLFGTVWGIKNSFEAIAMQQNTNLAVVAPGIAEALVATALGLLAAIPAVVAYNRLSAEADALIGRMENFVDEFAAILSRQLELEG
ncbi:protein TolQ [Oceanicella actignis]|uniref:Tol-Pal system protein TolQ n=1 Tax=Oceanicella actignis TaxID=1189325 RepID=A0A1M7TVW1_9RHOB|nr:protein TolQ [Oceanicella actignis]TYO90427.1 biopolymer transport protein TolQ [Oceanicella actignis]SES80890.1 Cell division and transport-associated protein TolQ (TC 2.C.1.2.1) [Oceanicella actignis]SHN74842.1 biopolymer transport protein TolQ [Oceanicella actignis]